MRVLRGLIDQCLVTALQLLQFLGLHLVTEGGMPLHCLLADWNQLAKATDEKKQSC